MSPCRRLRDLSLLAAVAGIAAAAWSAAPNGAFAQQQTENPDVPWASSSTPPHGNWRSRAILEQQRRAVGPATRMSGDEAKIILDNYRKSIGKGGAGADLLPQKK